MTAATPMRDTTGPESTAAILSIGDELTLGQTVDTNAAWIADRLTSLGVRVIEHATVDDDLGRMVSTIRRLAAVADTIIATGGLGPTADDLSREALATVLGETLVEDGRALTRLREWYAGRGPMPEANRVQAMRPESAELLDNPNGTAPGLGATIRGPGPDGTRAFFLPGPPHEMQPMFERYVADCVTQRAGSSIRARLLLTFGLGESAVAERLGELMDRDRERLGLPTVGTTASRGVVTVRLRHRGPDAGVVSGELDGTESDIRARLGDVIFDRRDPATGDSIGIANGLAEHIVRRLAEQGSKLVVAESCTGGLLGQELTTVSGASDVFAGGWLTYSNEAKAEMLGVPTETIATHGAVSRPCAEEMARGARNRAHEMGLAADYALSITGIAGPGGGSDAKPVGTVWIGLAGPDGVEARRFLFRGGRQAVREWAARSALGTLRLQLDGVEMSLLGQVE